MAILKRIASILERLVPRQADPETERQSRLLLWFVIVLESQVILFSSFYALLGATIPAVLVFCVGVTFTATPWLLNRFGQRIAMDAVAVQTFVILDALSWFTGGQSAPSLTWTALVPIMVTMVAGRSRGGVWLGAAAVNAATFSLGAFAQVPFRNILSPTTANIIGTSAVIMLACVVYAFALVYEATKSDMQRTLAAAHAAIQRVLDNVGQGFFVAGASGVASTERSAVVGTWFPESSKAVPFWQWLVPLDSRLGDAFEVSWQQIFDGCLPIEVAIAQLPTKLDLDNRSLAIEYRAIGGSDGAEQQVMVILSDVSQQVEATRKEIAQRENAAMFERLFSDRAGFMQFWDEATALVEELRQSTAHPRRAIHTLKGICLVTGLHSVATACQSVEASLDEEQRDVSARDVEMIATAWERSTSRIVGTIKRETDSMHVKRSSYDALRNAIESNVEHRRLSEMVKEWGYEETSKTFSRFAEHAQALCTRLGKPAVEVEIKDHGVRLDPQTWGRVWSTLGHAIRNAVDHGIEAPDERQAAGKPPAGHLQFVSRVDNGEVAVEVCDDGRGIDWERVRSRARDVGLPHKTMSDLRAALMSDGFTTRSQATEVSGRGVGLSALQESALALGARIDIVSERVGAGTRICLRAPLGASYAHK